MQHERQLWNFENINMGYIATVTINEHNKKRFKYILLITPFMIGMTTMLLGLNKVEFNQSTFSFNEGYSNNVYLNLKKYKELLENKNNEYLVNRSKMEVVVEYSKKDKTTYVYVLGPNKKDNNEILEIIYNESVSAHKQKRQIIEIEKKILRVKIDNNKNYVYDKCLRDFELTSKCIRSFEEKRLNIEKLENEYKAISQGNDHINFTNIKETHELFYSKMFKYFIEGFIFGLSTLLIIYTVFEIIKKDEK